MKNTLCKTIYILMFAVFVWTASLAVPIYSRSFYFEQLDASALDTTASEQEIEDAYNDMMDFLTLHEDFSLGTFSYSQAGKEHFEDCQKLFDANLALMLISFAALAVLIGLEIAGKISLKMRGGFHATFYACIIALSIPLVIAGLSAINFEKAFEIMHKVLFPGKQNWLFDPSTDPIINVLPMQYFASCALLAVGVLALFAFAGMLISGIIRALDKQKVQKSVKKSVN